ncbi:MAG: archaeosortase/exosortase family protein, partial [Deltaproteobacteria bacterium]|nr:archaeosortase/exosortase family protein [Deltaproteobacteria bacterium]
MTSDSRGNAIVCVSLISLVAAFCFQYWVDFGNLLIRWGSGDFSYCYLVPVIFAYLVWTNRHLLSGMALRPSAWGLVVAGASGTIYLAGKLGSIVTLAFVGIWTALVAMTLLVVGPRVVRALAFPFLILIFIVPLP